MDRHMLMRSKDITGSAPSTIWLRTSITEGTSGCSPGVCRKRKRKPSYCRRTGRMTQMGVGRPCASAPGFQGSLETACGWRRRCADPGPGPSPRSGHGAVRVDRELHGDGLERARSCGGMRRALPRSPCSAICGLRSPRSCTSARPRIRARETWPPTTPPTTPPSTPSSARRRNRLLRLVRIRRLHLRSRRPCGWISACGGAAFGRSRPRLGSLAAACARRRRRGRRRRRRRQRPGRTSRRRPARRSPSP